MVTLTKTPRTIPAGTRVEIVTRTAWYRGMPATAIGHRDGMTDVRFAGSGTVTVPDHLVREYR